MEKASKQGFRDGRGWFRTSDLSRVKREAIVPYSARKDLQTGGFPVGRRRDDQPADTCGLPGIAVDLGSRSQLLPNGAIGSRPALASARRGGEQFFR
jgi:hypothetical protein